jgi:hypothetical protein
LDGNDTLKDFSQIQGTIRIGNDQHPITLLQNPYNPLNFSNDIIASLNREVTPNDNIEVTIFLDSSNHQTMQLANAMAADAISWQDALRVAVDCKGSEIEGQTFETYVTILKSQAVDAGSFWLVRFITQDGKIISCVIAPDGSSIK